ncbi:hypothetical protein PMAYCL1PPCAC_18110, partial [Pristionchus mayeri]
EKASLSSPNEETREFSRSLAETRKRHEFLSFESAERLEKMLIESERRGQAEAKEDIHEEWSPSISWSPIEEEEVRRSLLDLSKREKKSMEGSIGSSSSISNQAYQVMDEPKEEE